MNDDKVAKAFLQGIKDAREMKLRFEEVEGDFSCGGELSRLGAAYLAGTEIGIAELAKESFLSEMCGKLGDDENGF